MGLSWWRSGKICGGEFQIGNLKFQIERQKQIPRRLWMTASGGKAKRNKGQEKGGGKENILSPRSSWLCGAGGMTGE